MGLLGITVPDQGDKAANLAEAQRIAGEYKRHKVTSKLRYKGEDVDADGGTVHHYEADTDKPTSE